MRVKRLLFLFIAISLTINQAISNELSDDYFDMAKNFERNGEYTKALEYTNYALIIEPRNKEAIKFKDKLIPTESNDDISTTAIVLSKQKTLSDLSILDIPKSDKYKVENSSEYYNQQGKQYYLNEEYDNAIQSFFRAISVDNKNHVAYNNLGMTYLMKNNLDAAEKYFKKSASVSKYYVQPYINLALLYKQKGNNEKYFSYLEKALKVNPDNYWTYYLMGDYYNSNEMYSAAIPFYTDSININPNFSQAYLALGVSYFKTDKYDQSILAIRKYLELNQKSDFAYHMLSKNYYLKGDYPTAKKYIKTAITINPINQYRLELAKIEFNNADYKSALLNFQILEPEYQYAEIYNYIGLCYLMLNKYELAITNFNKAIVIDSRRPIYYYNLAQCYNAIDDKKKYVQYINIAMQIVPATYQDYIDLSCIYYNNSKNNLAIKMLENGIEVYPDSKPLYMALMGLYDKIGDKNNYNYLKNTIEMRFNSNEQKKTFKLFK